jgi:hypothetical protein
MATSALLLTCISSHGHVALACALKCVQTHSKHSNPVPAGTLLPCFAYSDVHGEDAEGFQKCHSGVLTLLPGAAGAGKRVNNNKLAFPDPTEEDPSGMHVVPFNQATIETVKQAMLASGGMGLVKLDEYKPGGAFYGPSCILLEDNATYVVVSRGRSCLRGLVQDDESNCSMDSPSAPVYDVVTSDNDNDSAGASASANAAPHSSRDTGSARPPAAMCLAPSTRKHYTAVQPTSQRLPPWCKRASSFLQVRAAATGLHSNRSFKLMG